MPLDEDLDGFAAALGEAQRQLGIRPPRAPRPMPTHAPILDDEAAIPERRWIGGYGALPRGKLVMLAGPPGVSKTTLVISVSIALAAGQPWAGIVEGGPPQRVLLGAVEDEIDEIRRRAHAIIPLIADSPRLRALVAKNFRVVDLADAVPLVEVTRDGIATETDGFRDLIATISDFRADLVWLDPLIEMHTAEENSNNGMRPVLKAFRNAAAKHDCTFGLLHHEVKSGEGNALQRARGAGAIGGAIRGLWSLRPMTAEEAQEFHIPEDTRDLYSRLETGKSQYARRAANRWFVTEEVELANGDRAHRIVPWVPPSANITPEILSAAITCIRNGRGGTPLNNSNKSEACFRKAFGDVGIPGSLHIKLLDSLIAAGTVEFRGWRDPGDRKVRRRLWTSGTRFDGWQETEE